MGSGATFRRTERAVLQNGVGACRTRMHERGRGGRPTDSEQRLFWMVSQIVDQVAEGGGAGLSAERSIVNSDDQREICASLRT